ncbi:hypothetical protein DV735_g150, partial [Chaetothyriales sp. CBS 134920]
MGNISHPYSLVQLPRLVPPTPQPRLLPPELLPSTSGTRSVAEATRGLGNGNFLHHLPLYSPTALDLADPKRFFIPYLNHGYLEVQKELIERICPADLCGKACPFNNIFFWEESESGHDSQKTGSRGAWLFGCRFLRLCYSVQAHRLQPPPPMPLPIYQVSVRNAIAARNTAPEAAGSNGRGSGKIAGLMTAGQMRRKMFRWSERRRPEDPMSMMCKIPANHPNHSKACPFIHHVEKTCRHVLKKNDGVQHCPKVLDIRGGGCPYGHDFEQERVAAWHRLQEHVRDAEEWRSEPGVVWRNEKGGWMGLDESSIVLEDEDEAEEEGGITTKEN